MTTQEIVSKLWNLCNVLRDDGITYHQYVTELTYILFLKMAKETGVENQIPEAYRWDELTAKSGIELKKFYKELSLRLTNWIGFQLVKKDLGTCMKGFWRKMPMRKNLGQDNISRLVC